MEKERDEIVRKEADLRRKAREVVRYIICRSHLVDELTLTLYDRIYERKRQKRSSRAQKNLMMSFNVTYNRRIKN